MVCALDVQDDVVAGEVDLDHGAPGGHQLEQIVGMVLLHHVNAVADAFGMCLFDGGANMKAQSVRRHHSGRQLAGVQCDVHLGVEGVERTDHLHLLTVVGHGDAPVLRLHHIDPHDEWVGGGELESADQLDKDHLRRQGAQHLVEEAHLEIAGRRSSACAAMFQLAAAALAFIELRTLLGQVLG